MRDETLIRPDILPAECKVHGKIDFKYILKADLWACLGTLNQVQAGVEGDALTHCSSVILGEDFTPDGVDVSEATSLRWGLVTFNETQRFGWAWNEYFYWCYDARRVTPNV